MPNLSEGRNHSRLDRWRRVLGSSALDVHIDPDHHRSVFTVCGEESVRLLATWAVNDLDLGSHHGVHPRIGVIDVVPFVDLADRSDPTGETVAAVEARDQFMKWASTELDLPVFTYGSHRTLPDIRRGAFTDLAPDAGPHRPHPTAGAVAVGCRTPLVAYNLWLRNGDLDTARRLAQAVRGPAVRALGLQVGSSVQVSMNLIDPDQVGPHDLWDAVAAHHPIERGELVGLLPASVLARVPESRWASLNLSRRQTIEARLAARAACRARST